MSDPAPTEKTKPVHKILSRDNLITVAIWPRDTEYGPRHSVTRNRRYQDKDGNWQDTQFIYEDDMLEVIEMEREAFAWIRERRHANAQDRKAKAKQADSVAA
jgi:hypothetical protein